MTPATDTNTRRADLRVLDKYLLPPHPHPPHTLLRLIPMICFAGESEVQSLESRDGENCFNGSFSERGGGERFQPSSAAAFLSCHGSAGIIKALLITFSYDLDLKGQGNQYNSH